MIPEKKNLMRGLVGAVLGAAIGAAAWKFLLSRGIYAPLLICGAAGIASGWLAIRRHLLLGVQAAVVGLFVQLLAEAWLRPFVDSPVTPQDESSVFYFITHLHKLDPFYIGNVAIPALALWLAGAAMAVVFGMGRNRRYVRTAEGEETDGEKD